VRALCLGGSTRQESAYRGLQAAAALDLAVEWAVVHDGARPLVTAELVAACLAAARAHGAAVAATPVTDTIKRVNAAGLVRRTPPRSKLWAAQTPQVGRLHDLLQAHAQARAAGLEATDDAALLEGLGISVKVVPAPAENIKITTLHDLEVARMLLQRRGKEQSA
jgi:2-C-methyl-D-erythritol 4-phosphate cytidylyltransferase